MRISDAKPQNKDGGSFKARQGEKRDKKHLMRVRRCKERWRRSGRCGGCGHLQDYGCRGLGGGRRPAGKTDLSLLSCKLIISSGLVFVLPAPRLASKDMSRC